MARKGDPALGYTYIVDIAKAKGYFTSISGLGSSHTVATHKVVNEQGKEFEIKMPARLQWEDVTIKRGLTDDMAFWQWRDLVVNGKLDEARTDCTITMLNRDYQKVTEWTLLNAWPSKMTGVTVSSESNDFLIEEMVITHEGIKRDTAEGYPASPPKA
ncbi:MAG: phage tail protein [Caldilineaceae bacterium]